MWGWREDILSTSVMSRSIPLQHIIIYISCYLIFGGFVPRVLSKENVEGGFPRTNGEAQSFIRLLTFNFILKYLVYLRYTLPYYYLYQRHYY